jgi:dehydrogenase/reductase SDR family member 12
MQGSIRFHAAVGADLLLEATVVASFSRVGFEARRRLFGWDEEEFGGLPGRLAVVTGASGGIGLAAAADLARGGAEVWMVGRDPARIQAAVEQVEVSVEGARVVGVLADLSVLDDVRALANHLRQATSALDILIHNAGTLGHELRYTDDGLEVTAQVHVVAPFLATMMLLPLLHAAPDPRVITVSSGGMYTQRLEVGALASPSAPFDGPKAYANAKRAQVVLNHLWSRLPSAAGIGFHAMHPGWVDTPGLRQSLPHFHRMTRSILRTPSQGADTIIWLASSPSPGAANGRFWLDRRPRLVAPVPRTHTSAAAAAELWEWCADRADISLTIETPL